MTNLQVAYQNMLETRRSNLAKEQESVRHNRASEWNEARKVSETVRHNVATEGQQKIITDEEIRSNMANEAIKRAQNYESARHNLASEAEMNRSNLAKEAIDANRVAETVRSNVANEEIKRAQHILNETLGYENLALDAQKATALTKLQGAQTESEGHRQSLMDAQKWQAYAGAANTSVSAVGSVVDRVAAIRGLGFKSLIK